MRGFQPINEILTKAHNGTYDTEDLIELSPFNCNLFSYTMLKLPFKRWSPAQERIFDTFYNPELHYKELELICGRKSGKSIMSTTLLLYEIYKLLALIDDPQAYYGLMSKDHIYCMLVGPSKEQVQDVGFGYIKSFAKSSPYLRNFIVNETNEELEFDKNIVVKVLTSSSRSGRGYAAITIIYDEIAHFIDNRGNLSGAESYYALQPNLKPLSPDSRSVLLTSPAGKSGIAWEQFRSGDPVHVIQETPEHGEEGWRAVFQRPTWEMNPKLPFNCLADGQLCKRADSKECRQCTSNELYLDFRSNPEKFAMEYGAEFCDAVDAALNADKILRIATGRFVDMVTEDKTTPRVISIDPALSGNSYALAMGHKEEDIIIIDFVKYWQGQRDSPVKISIVEQFIEEKLWKNFYLTHIIVDQYQSASTVQRLNARGIPIYMIHATNQYNQMAYEYMINRINMETIRIPYHKETIEELTFLQRKQQGKTVRYEAAIGHNDDIADCLARVVYTLDVEGSRKLHVGFGDNK